ncbi:MAG: hypothetical protein EXR29_03870 [Betaproteobacteria bacterium]|nr:hypothetical protein [Betaproteobacteria bacterium]
MPNSGAFNTFKAELMCGAGGAEIAGLDLSKPLSADTLGELRRALADHCVLFFRDQTLEPDEQKAFACQFGPLAQTPFIQPLEGHPEMTRVVREADETKKQNFGGRWHSDLTFQTEPVLGTVLYSRVSPPVGGDTVWTNQMLASHAYGAAARLAQASSIATSPAAADKMLLMRVRGDTLCGKKILMREPRPAADNPGSWLRSLRVAGDCQNRHRPAAGPPGKHRAWAGRGPRDVGVQRQYSGVIGDA